MAVVPNRHIRGIRNPMPPGTVIGVPPGASPATLQRPAVVPIIDLAQQLLSTTLFSRPGDGGNVPAGQRLIEVSHARYGGV